ncbi:MAG: hypothetical protein CMH13_01540 [Martelella sp.]|nr:hypothetical protein [Martelella sp.]
MREPRWWFSLSLTLLCFLLVFLLFSTWYVFDGSTLPTGVKDKVDTLWRIGAGLIALITFITVIWRGMMTDQQTREQRRQNDANDDAAYASLLVEGTKLLGEESDHHKRAGVAILLRVIDDPSCDKNGRPDRLQQQALDILASEWAQNYKLFNLENYTSFLYRALFSKRKPSLFASFDLKCSDIHPKDKDEMGRAKPKHDERWMISGGFKKQTYLGGVGLIDPVEGILFKGIIIEFKYTEIVDSNVTNYKPGIKFKFNRCIFVDCNIEKITPDDVAFSTFICCNFTGCEFAEDTFFDIEDALETATFLNDETRSLFDTPGNWYDLDNPPKARDGFSEWDTFLEPRKRIGKRWCRKDPTSQEWKPA